MPDPDNYEECFHVHPEIWWAVYKNENITAIEELLDLGALSEFSMFVPKVR